MEDDWMVGRGSPHPNCGDFSGGRFARLPLGEGRMKISLYYI